MGVTAAKQCCEQMICKNKVTPFRTQTVEPASSRDREDGMTNIDENTQIPNFSQMLDSAGDVIPMPIKKMAWDMVPPNSKLKSVLEFCKKTPTNSPNEETISKAAEWVNNPVEIAATASAPPPPVPLPTVIEPSVVSNITKELENIPKNIVESETMGEMIAEPVETWLPIKTVDTQVKPSLLHPDSVSEVSTADK